MDQQRASQGPDGSYSLDASQSFTYQALSKELHVGNVYLRVYNNQPDFEISEPEVFCIALLEFISGLVNSLSAQDSDIQGRTIQNGYVGQSELQSDNADEPDGRENIDDLVSISSREETCKGDYGLVINLQVSLISLQVQNEISRFTQFVSSLIFYVLICAEFIDEQTQAGSHFFYEGTACISFSMFYSIVPI